MRLLEPRHSTELGVAEGFAKCFCLRSDRRGKSGSWRINQRAGGRRAELVVAVKCTCPIRGSNP